MEKLKLIDLYYITIIVCLIYFSIKSFVNHRIEVKHKIEIHKLNIEKLKLEIEILKK